MKRTKNPTKSNVWTWFVNLSLEEKSRVLSIEDKDCVQLIQKMFKKKTCDGEGLFFAVDDGFDMKDNFPNSCSMKKSQYIFTNKNDFCFMKLGCLDKQRIISYPEYLLVPDRELENSLRLCDTREYLDTMTVATDLLEDPYKLLRLMERASRGSFLTSPCRVEYHSKNNQWIWETPTWFNGMGFYSLGTYICHKFEQAMWIRYWDFKNLDPRVPNTRRKFSFPNHSSQALLSKTHLTEFWINTEQLVRLQLIGGLGSIVDHALQDSETESYKETSKTIASTPSPIAAIRYRKGSDASNNTVLPQDLQRLSALIDFCMEKKAMEFLFAAHKDKSKVNQRRFIEFLYFSPLKTAGTPINFVLRRLGFIIQKAYMEKLKMDLILGEESEKKKKRNNNFRSNNKNRKKNSNSNRKKMFKRKLAATAKHKPPKKPKVSIKPPVEKVIKTTTIKKTSPIPIRKDINKSKLKQQNHKNLNTKSTNTPKNKTKNDKDNNNNNALKRASLSPSALYKRTIFQNNDEIVNNSNSSNIPLPDINDDSWMEVAKRKRKKKKKGDSSNSAPVSPRNKNIIKHQINIKRQSSCDDNSLILKEDKNPDLKQNTQLSKEPLKEPLKDSLNRRYSSPNMVPNIDKNINQISSNKTCIISKQNEKDKNLSHTLRTRSSSCSPTPKSNPSSAKRSHSASARSRNTPLHQKNTSKTNESNINKTQHSQSSSQNITSPTIQKKRVLIDKSKNHHRSRFQRPRKYAQMFTLHSFHEKENDYSLSLSNEIKSYVSFLKQVVNNHQNRLVDKVLQRVRCIVGSLWSSAFIKLYGSVSVGLCIPESDLDLVVCIPENVGGSPVLLLAGELKGKSWVKQLQAIYTAKVPVIKLVIDNLAVDITFDIRSQTHPNIYAQTDLDHTITVSSHTGLRTKDYILQLKKDYPALEPLVLIIKQYLYCVLLNSSYTGGLASYSIVLMVASFLKYYNKKSQNIGTLLLGFFELYGKHFDYNTTGISITEPESPFFTRDQNGFNNYGPAQLLIVDPLCGTNNIGSGTFAMYRVKQAFANGYNTLIERSFASPFTPTQLSRLLPIMMNNGYRS